MKTKILGLAFVCIAFCSTAFASPGAASDRYAGAFAHPRIRQVYRGQFEIVANETTYLFVSKNGAVVVEPPTFPEPDPAQVGGGTGFTVIASPTGTSYTDTTCPLQSSCYYQLTAVDSFGAESLPASCAATQLCVGGNTAVAQMPSSGTHTVTVSWIASTSTVANYKVYRHIGPLPGSNVTTTVN